MTTHDNFSFVAGALNRFAEDTFNYGSLKIVALILGDIKKKAVSKYMRSGRARNQPPIPGKLTVRSRALAEAVLGTGQNRDAHIESVWLDSKGAAGKVGVKKTGSLPYPVIHEYGGIIRAKRAPYLVFKLWNGTVIKTKQVTMPERSYIRAAHNNIISSGMPKKRLDQVAREMIRKHNLK